MSEKEVNTPNSHNEAFLHASKEGHLPIVELLLKAGADINIQSKNGNTALIIASQYGHLAIVEALMNAGAYINFEKIRMVIQNL